NTMQNLTLYRASVLHTPQNAFQNPGALVAFDDGAVVVQNGVILEMGDYSSIALKYPTAQLEDMRGAVLLPGFIDTHIHYPQGRVLGGLGMALLEWLEVNTLPEEVKFSSRSHAKTVAREFLYGLASHGTTTALVFGSHFASAMHEFFTEAENSGLRIVAGQVVSDRLLRPELHTTPEAVYTEGKMLIQTFHQRGRLLYAVTPRFSLSASEAILEACGALYHEFEGLRFTSHINENTEEVRTVQQQFGKDYLESYERFGLVARRSVLAHNIHATDSELGRMASAGASVSHCPCSNSSLGSGFFPLKRHLEHGVHVALGTDVGGGTGFGMPKEALQAYMMQQQMPNGYKLKVAQLLYLATLAGAEALDLQEQTGDFSSGKAFDAVLIQPAKNTPLEILFQNASDLERMLAGIFTLGSSADVAKVWVEGQVVYQVGTT
ncbi:MAG: guanine deaminase, partial [Deinococcales bacterium]